MLVAAVGTFGAWQPSGGRDTRKAGVTSSAEPPEPPSNFDAGQSIAATVPAEIRDTGRLVVGVNLPYAPNEFKDANGQIVGFDVDLLNAMARTLGLTPEYRETAFDATIPSVRAKGFNVGMSSFTDTADREATVDFVTYFQAGTLWAQKAGSSVDPENACGLKAGVSFGALQETEEIPALMPASMRGWRPSTSGSTCDRTI